MPNSRRTSSVNRNADARQAVENGRIRRNLTAEEAILRPIQISSDQHRALTAAFDSLLQGLESATDSLAGTRESVDSMIERNSRAMRILRESHLMSAARPTAGRQPTGSLDLSEEITHAAPMAPQQIKQSIEARSETNQDIKFLEKKKCSVCLGSWKEILMEGKHLVFTKCGHIFCRDCAIRFASEGKRECPLCKKSLAGVNPPFRRLHMPLDPRLKKSRAD